MGINGFDLHGRPGRAPRTVWVNKEPFSWTLLFIRAVWALIAIVIVGAIYWNVTHKCVKSHQEWRDYSCSDYAKPETCSPGHYEKVCDCWEKR